MLSPNDQKENVADIDEQTNAEPLTIMSNRLNYLKELRKNGQLNADRRNEYEPLKKDFKKLRDEIKYDPAQNQLQPVQNNLDFNYIEQKFEFVPISGDGNCFYAAVGDYLGEKHDVIRAETIITIRNNLDFFRPAILAIYDESVGFNPQSYADLASMENPPENDEERYLIVASQDGIYADNIEIQALVQSYQRPVVILYANRPPQIINNEGQTVDDEHLPMFICHNGLQNGLAHYDLLNPKEGVDLIEIYNHIAQNANVRYQQPDGYLYGGFDSSYAFIDSESEEENLSNKPKKSSKKQKKNTPRKLWKRLKDLEEKLTALS